MSAHLITSGASTSLARKKPIRTPLETSPVNSPSATVLPALRSRAQMLPFVAVAAFLMACQTAQPEEANKQAESSAGSTEATSDGEEDLSPGILENWLKELTESPTTEDTPSLSVTAADQQWRLSYPNLLGPEIPLDIDIALHPHMTVIMAPLLTLPSHTPKELLVALLSYNYELYQAKLALNDQGRLYLGFEVPNRLLDRQEFRDNVHSLVSSAGTIAHHIASLLQAGEDTPK